MPGRFRGFTEIIIVLAILIAAAVSLGIALTLNGSGKEQANVSQTINKITQASDPAPEPDPFFDMTMPYLRSREYTSTLGELKKYEEGSNYTSFITSYDSDGLKVNGLLTVPDSPEPAKGFPAIVFVHGYIPPSIYKTTEKYEDYVDYLARNGFVVFKVDLRGNGDSEGEASGAYYSGDYIVDTLNAYAALQNADFVDTSRVGLWGHSMAGNVTFRAFVAKQNIPALAIWAGAVYTYEDMAKYGLNDNSYRPPSETSERQRKRQLLRDTHGNFDASDGFWKTVPATNYLDGVSGAVEINHAVDDSVVSVGYSRDLMKILDETAIKHQLFEYPTGGHNILSPSFDKAMQRTVEFFKQNL